MDKRVHISINTLVSQKDSKEACHFRFPLIKSWHIASCLAGMNSENVVLSHISCIMDRLLASKTILYMHVGSEVDSHA